MTPARDDGPATQPVAFAAPSFAHGAARSWPIPVEVALALPMSPKVLALVRARALRTQATRGATAELLVRRKRFFAQVFYGQANNESVLFPLDVWET